MLCVLLNLRVNNKKSLSKSCRSPVATLPYQEQRCREYMVMVVHWAVHALPHPRRLTSRANRRLEHIVEGAWINGCKGCMHRTSDCAIAKDPVCIVLQTEHSAFVFLNGMWVGWERSCVWSYSTRPGIRTYKSVGYTVILHVQRMAHAPPFWVVCEHVGTWLLSCVSDKQAGPASLGTVAALDRPCG
jgi:hypothetical protein